MRKMLFIFLAMLMVSCAGAEELAPEPALPTEEPAATSTPLEDQSAGETESPTVTAVTDPDQPTSTPAPTTALDLSGVELVEATHLMDPKHFQVVLENWPEDLSEGTLVLVDGVEFNCDELFPDDYPNRVYCWGEAPPSGEDVSMQVTAPGFSTPLLEIPFTVPSPGGG